MLLLYRIAHSTKSLKYVKCSAVGVYKFLLSLAIYEGTIDKAKKMVKTEFE